MTAESGNPYGSVSSDVRVALDELNADEGFYVPEREAEELFYLPDSVHLFFVRSDGRVSTFSEPSTLRIFRFKKAEGEESTNPTFIQVGGWSHPLIPGQSPVLEAGNGAFMFPDVYSAGSDPEAAVGIVIADGTPFNLEGEAQEALATLLADLTDLKRVEAVDPALRLGKIGKTLVGGAQLISQGIEKGAEKATALIEYVGEKQMANSAEAGKDLKVNPLLKSTAKGAAYATTATVKVSGFVAKRVGKLTLKMAEYLASKVEKPVVGVTTGVSGSGQQGSSSSMQNLADAARGGIFAYATVYDGLERSAKVLGQSLKSQTVQVVTHQYGQEAGQSYDDSMTAAGNAAMTYMNIQSLGVKGIVKSTAKKTGKNLGKAVVDAHPPAAGSGPC